MNNKRRKRLADVLSELQSIVEEERETLDNQENAFGSTDRWQTADEKCLEAENLVDKLETHIGNW